MRQILAYCLAAALAVLTAGCNRSEVITTDPAPVIALDNPSGVYTVKVGREVTVSPTVSHADGARYTWLVDGAEAGSGPSFTASFAEEGQYYVTFRVETRGGSDEAELRIDVVALNGILGGAS